jgi:hypothetical protein
MPYADPAARNKANARYMRRARYYSAAVRAGDPKAIEAERNRTLDAMAPATALYAEIAAMPPGQGVRRARKPEYDALHARCLDDRDAALAAYDRLRREVIAEAYDRLRREVIAEAEARAATAAGAKRRA